MTTACCTPWPIIWPCDGLPSGATDEMKAAAEQGAQTLLWSRMGRRHGLCSVTERFTPVPSGQCGPGPWLDDRLVWHNPVGIGSALLLSWQPVVLVSEVKVDGVAVNVSTYQLSGGFLERVGSAWPASPLAVPTVDVTYLWGVPLNGALWGLVSAAMGEVATELLNAMCGSACRISPYAATTTRSGVTVARDKATGKSLGLPLADSLIQSVNPGGRPARGAVHSPDLPRASRPAAVEPPGAQNVGGVSTVRLADAYEGDPYEFTLRFPDVSFLAGAPGNVTAQVKVEPSDVVPAATFVASVTGPVLTLTLDPNPLVPGDYWTDVQVGDTTYLFKTRLTVNEQVSS